MPSLRDSYSLAGIDGLYDNFYAAIQNIQFQVKGKSECAKQVETNLLASNLCRDSAIL